MHLEVVTPAGLGTTDIFVLNRVAGGAIPAESSRLFEYREGGFIRGDVDGDGDVDITDGLRLFRALTKGVDLDCASSADADDSGAVDITDGIHLLGYLFGGVAAPVAPFPGCGVDVTPDELGCTGGSVCAG